MVTKFEWFDNDVDEYPKKKKEIMKMIRCLLYNDRDIVQDTRQLIEDQSV